ncbi:TlpA family protein disulfide reductase [Sediminibacterium ginsengisoli]|uniref:Thiol-disulfide isomerase or thioredoxin n=1 Tax=Sediminibacterium ginsengisoli TaxID=413434 RepID=A0A1T4MMF0_9BACT|nr:TlpA family protein disulfide reductase [Sediminibacterium ginsengisoli]SJZ67965.1 Thiol-disulfide isomerase or thioredoxin [Sediminibacterium ginsengisoli]
MRSIIAFLLFAASFVSVTAQQKTPAKAPAKTPAATSAASKGRNISITLTPLKNTKVYLGSYMGKSMVLMDSAVLNDKSQGVFKGPNKLTGGIYFVVSPQMTIQFDLLMDDKQQFSISGDTALKQNAMITGSMENDLFRAYSQFSAVKGKKRQELEAAYHAATTKADSTRIAEELTVVGKEIQQYRDDITQKYPNTLLAMLFNTMKIPATPAIPVVKGKPDSLYPYRFVKDHYWDDVSFNDDRLLRTPFFEPKLDDYFKYYVSPEPDSIIQEVKYMLLTARTGKEIYPYLLTKFTNKYMTPEYMGQDKVFVYLFENFYAKGDTMLLNPASRKTITERAYFLMANQLGQPAPALDLTDTLGKTASLYNIKAPFTAVVFWDPNCGHCKEEIPRLDSLYKARWKKLNVAIYSVNIYENEIPAWKKFLREHKIEGWIQAYETKAAKEAGEKAGKANYRQLYDITKTPTMYLLDKDKKIIAKQLSLEQFDDLITAKLKASGQ